MITFTWRWIFGRSTQAESRPDVSNPVSEEEAGAPLYFFGSSRQLSG
jgi:hypothetical protein